MLSAPEGRKIDLFFRPFHGLDVSRAESPQFTLWAAHLTPLPGLVGILGHGRRLQDVRRGNPSEGNAAA